MYRAILLDVAAIADDYFSPVATQCCSRTYVNIFANDYVSRNCRIRMNKRRLMYYRFVPVEFKYIHVFSLRTLRETLRPLRETFISRRERQERKVF